MKEPTARQLAEWQKSIADSGQLSTKLGRVLTAFGIERRTEKARGQIAAFLASRTPPVYVDGLDDLELTKDDTITLTHTRIEKNGSPWREDGERGSEHSFLKKHGTTLLTTAPLSLKVVKREYSAPNTRDAMDYLCEDEVGNPVVVEFKVDHGERRSVEQLLRYTYQVARDPKYAKTGDPKGVLITAQADFATRDALATLDPFELVEWYLYGFDAGGRLNPLKRVESIPRSGNPRRVSTHCLTCGRPAAR